MQANNDKQTIDKGNKVERGIRSRVCVYKQNELVDKSESTKKILSNSCLLVVRAVCFGG